ncbi:MAG: abscisic acid-deficient protein Aba4 family protein [Rhizobacter sp.]
MTTFPFPDPDTVFGAASSLAMLGWTALSLSPAGARWAGAVRLLAGRVVPLLLAVVYVVLFARNGMADGGYGSLAEVQRLLAVPELLTAGWLHYLAFDLFVGAWIAERGAALGLPHLALLPLLALTFLFGPAGLLAFVTLRAFVHWWRRYRGGVVAAAA